MTTTLVTVAGCASCPFLCPPHCELLRSLGESRDRVMDRRDRAPLVAPPHCRLRGARVAVELVEQPRRMAKVDP